MSEDRLIIESAIISDPLKVFVYEIENSISDIEIFEHIDKPYLTGIVNFVDSVGVFDTIQFKGIETFELTLRFPDNEDRPVKRTFIIDKIINTTKNNDKSELITFHIIEEIGFISTFLNVNKAYEGSSREIIEKIFFDYFDNYKLSKADIDELKDTMQLIVPNMTPLEACNWIKDRTTSVHGTPYYLFSTLSNQNVIHFLPLSTMLAQNTGPNEYVYSQSGSAVEDRIARGYVIEDYNLKDGNNISNLVDKSLIGAEFSFLDTATVNARKIKHDSINKFKLTPDTNGDSFIFNNDYTYKGKKLNEIVSRKTFQVNTSYSYQDHKSFREFSSTSNAVWSKALRNIITSNSIDIAVSGRNFLNAETNRTIGNLIKLRFLNNNIADENSSLFDVTDKVKSGKHLIYSTRHIIRKEKYDIVFSCVKLENIK